MNGGGDELGRRLVALFRDELDENLVVLTEGIVALERFVGGHPPDELLQTLFRAAHSTKGAAHSAAVHRAVVAAGALEEHLVALRGRSTPVTHDVVDALLVSVDALANVARSLRSDKASPRRAEPEATTREPRVVRVPAEKLDGLMGHLVGLMALAEAADAPGGVSPSPRELRRVTTAVADAAAELRMQRFGELCEGLPRVARDIARESGKQVEAVVGGSEVELDRAVGAAVREALVHLVRNAVDHGIEPPDDRLAQGKRSTGVVAISAALHDGALEIAVCDDGGGLDADELRAAARRIGETATDEAQLAFVPGLSTARQGSEVSGLGVGLDAVRADVEAIGGTVTLTSVAGSGTDVRLRVPRILSTTTLLLVRVAGHLFAVPALAVDRVVSIDPTRLRSVGSKTIAAEEGFAVGSLAGALGLDRAPTRASSVRALVCRVGAEEMALGVDELHGDVQAQIRPLPERVASSRLANGAVTLPSGVVVVVLDVLECARRALAAPRPTPPLVEEGGEDHRRLRVLLAEDSFTTRTLERSILQAAGYDVLPAVSGREAWDLLQRHGADVVVSDVDMPAMDGFELCRLIRSSPRFAELPVVLVTSLAQEEHRRQGVEAGATAYVVKSAFDQRSLLAAIEELVS